jgi:hypothetical protein
MTEDTRTGLAKRFNAFANVLLQLPARVMNDELGVIYISRFSSRKNHLVMPIRGIEFPRCFEQLKEFPDHFMVRRVRNYTYHLKGGFS